jgi:hypothetical protein
VTTLEDQGPDGRIIRGPSENFLDWRQCTALMRSEAVNVMPSCSGGGNVVMA